MQFISPYQHTHLVQHCTSAVHFPLPAHTFSSTLYKCSPFPLTSTHTISSTLYKCSTFPLTSTQIQIRISVSLLKQTLKYIINSVVNIEGWNRKSAVEIEPFFIYHIICYQHTTQCIAHILVNLIQACRITIQISFDTVLSLHTLYTASTLYEQLLHIN